MRITLVIISFLLFGLALNAKGYNYSLSGRVFSNEGSVSATVSLYNSADSLLFSYYSSNGSFLFDSLAKGRYTVIVKPDAEKVDLVSTSKEFYVNSNITGVSIQLQSYFSVSGTVTASGLPADSVRLMLFDEVNSEVKSKVFYKGRFYLSSLPKGNYKIVAVPIDRDTCSYEQTETAWFDLSNNIKNIEIPLSQQSVEEFAVSGFVCNDEGEAVRAKLNLFSADSILIKEAFCNNNGRFYFDNLESGTYQIKAVPVAECLGKFCDTSLTISINSDEPIKSIRLTMEKLTLKEVDNKDLAVKVFPKPVYALMRIGSAQTADKYAILEMLNIRGKRFPIKMLKRNRSSLEVDVSNLENGVYMMSLYLSKRKNYYGSFVKR